MNSITPNVKRFIQTEKHLINNDDWATLFALWYNNYSQYDSPVGDSIQLAEFFDILEKAGMGDIEIKTYDLRKQLITQYIEDYIDVTVKNTNEKFVSLTGALNSLNSRLFLTLKDIRELFIEACQLREFEPYDANLTRYVIPRF